MHLHCSEQDFHNAGLGMQRNRKFNNEQEAEPGCLHLARKSEERHSIKKILDAKICFHIFIKSFEHSRTSSMSHLSARTDCLWSLKIVNAGHLWGDPAHLVAQVVARSGVAAR